MKRFAQCAASTVFAIGISAAATAVDFAPEFEPQAALTGQEVMSALQTRLQEQDSLEQAAQELETSDIVTAEDGRLESPLAAR